MKLPKESQRNWKTPPSSFAFMVKTNANILAVIHIVTNFSFNSTDADELGIPIGNRRLYLTQELLGRGNFGKVVKGELIGDNGSEAVAVKMLRGNKNYNNDTCIEKTLELPCHPKKELMFDQA